MARITIEQDAGLPDNGLFPAEVRMLATDGKEFIERREIPPGAPQRGWTPAEAEEKLRGCARSLITEATASRVADLIARLEELPDIAMLCEILEGNPPPS